VEIFGMAIMEAMYYRCSVAARRAIGPSLTLKGMRGHKLCDSDAEIEDWITGPYPPAEELAESAEKVVTDFSWRPCAKAFIQQIEAQRAR
jgi:1,2-diacylglycerol 3-alpha-glucosyltransferase